MVPPYPHDYLDIFSETAVSRFPARKPYDHKIELKEGFKEKRHKNYSLSPEEDTLLKTFIDKNLAKGYIQPSMSEMALSSLLERKMERNVHVKIINISMNGPRKMHTLYLAFQT